jgi:hypothetical protein
MPDCPLAKANGNEICFVYASGIFKNSLPSHLWDGG